MKKLMLVLPLMMAQGAAFAAAPQPTPVNVHVQRSPMDMLAIRLRQQNTQISRDEKAGKLTPAQAKTLKAQVEAIRKDEIADLKQNGTPSSGSTSPSGLGKTLTDAQISQLNQQLNTLSKTIPIK